MHDWFCQIELIESIWKKKAELRENSIVGEDGIQAKYYQDKGVILRLKGGASDTPPTTIRFLSFSCSFFGKNFNK